jgi:hypothetical protein
MARLWVLLYRIWPHIIDAMDAGQAQNRGRDRKGFRRHWRWRSRGPGQPTGQSIMHQRLAIRLAFELQVVEQGEWKLGDVQLMTYLI